MHFSVGHGIVNDTVVFKWNKIFHGFTTELNVP